MRLETSIRRAAKSSTRYYDHIHHPKYSAADAAQRLSSTFGSHIQQLPPSLRIELLAPNLQLYAHRRPLFENLVFTGRLFLGIQVNDHLGTRNVELPEHVIQRFCDIRGIGAEVGKSNGPNLLFQSIGAVNIFSGDVACREMIAKHIINGSHGLANIYLDDLAQRKF